MQRSNRFTKRLKPVPTNCMFCSGKTNPDYKDVQLLVKFTTERGKFMGKAKTGICAKHQRKLELAVKKARLVALLPFVVRA